MDYRIVDHPELQPGCCLLTRTSDGPFIDTGIDIEDLDPIGRIYIATSTVSDLAQGLGYAPPVATARMREHLAQLEVQIADHSATIAGLTAANTALLAAGYTAADAPLSVPAGSEQEILLWVGEPGDDLDAVLARCEAARDAELLEESPRPQLLSELASYLTLKETV